jgi:hypothetical protein
MKFRSTIQRNGKTATGIPVPTTMVDELNAGKRPKVLVTIGDHSYRSSIATWGDGYMLPFAAEHREATGLGAGDEVDVTLELDTMPRAAEVPPDFAKALKAEPKAKAFFESLSYSQQRWFVLGIEGAKKPETRQRRIDAAMDRLREGRGQR